MDWFTKKKNLKKSIELNKEAIAHQRANELLIQLGYPDSPVKIHLLNHIKWCKEKSLYLLNQAKGETR